MSVAQSKRTRLVLTCGGVDHRTRRKPRSAVVRLNAEAPKTLTRLRPVRAFFLSARGSSGESSRKAHVRMPKVIIRAESRAAETQSLTTAFRTAIRRAGPKL